MEKSKTTGRVHELKAKITDRKQYLDQNKENMSIESQQAVIMEIISYFRQIADENGYEAIRHETAQEYHEAKEVVHEQLAYLQRSDITLEERKAAQVIFRDKIEYMQSLLGYMRMFKRYMEENSFVPQGGIPVDVNVTVGIKNPLISLSNAMKDVFSCLRSANLESIEEEIASSGLNSNKSFYEKFTTILLDRNTHIGMSFVLLTMLAWRRNKVVTGLFFISISSLMLRYMNDMANIQKLTEVLPIWEYFGDEMLQMESVAPEGSEESADTIRPQSGESIDFISSSMLTLLCLGVGLRPKNGAINIVKELLKTSDSQKRNMYSVVAYVMKALSDFLARFNSTESLAQYFHVEETGDMGAREWCERVNLFIDLVSADRSLDYEQNTTQYNLFITEYMELVKHLKRANNTPILSIMNNTYNRLVTCYSTLRRRFESLRGSRVEPVCIMFKGEPHTFKSALSSRFAYALCELTLPDVSKQSFRDNKDKYIYTKPTDPWYDGYEPSTHVMIIDDAFQRVDSGTDTDKSEALDHIKLINNAEYALPMAEATKKNMAFARMAYVIDTANVFREELLASVHDKKAVSRRIHFKVEVTINPKYLRENCINYDKFSNLVDREGFLITETTAIPEDAWIFWVTYKENGIETTVQMDYYDLLEKVVLRHKAHSLHYEVNKAVDRLIDEKTRSHMADRFDLNFHDNLDAINQRIRSASAIFTALHEDDFIAQSGSPIRIDINQPIIKENVLTPDSEAEYYSDHSSTSVDSCKRCKSLHCVCRNFIKSPIKGNPIVISARKQSIIDHSEPTTYPVDKSLEEFMCVVDALDKEKSKLFWHAFCLMMGSYGNLTLIHDPRPNLATFYDSLTFTERRELYGLAFWLTNVSSKNKNIIYVLNTTLSPFGHIVAARRGKELCPLSGENIKIEWPSSFTEYKNLFFNTLKSLITFFTDNLLLMVSSLALLGGAIYCFSQGFRKLIEAQSGNTDHYISRTRGKASTSKSKSNKDGNTMPVYRYSSKDIIHNQSGVADGCPVFEIRDRDYFAGGHGSIPDIINTCIYKYFFIVYIKDLESGTSQNVTEHYRLGHAENVRGNWFSMCNHYAWVVEERLKKMKNPRNLRLKFITADNRKAHEVFAQDFLMSCVSTPEFSAIDGLLAQVGTDMNSRGTLRFHVKESQVHKWTVRSCLDMAMVGTYQTGSSMNTLTHRNFNMIGHITAETVVTADWDNNFEKSAYTLKRCVEYPGKFGKGDCGSVAYLTNNRAGCNILLGLHVAGSPRKGMCNIITQEMIEDVITRRIGKIICYDEEERCEAQGLSLYPVETNWTGQKLPDGEFDRPPLRNVRSNIIKSKLHGKLPGEYANVKTLPCKLRDFIYGPETVPKQFYEEGKDGLIISPSEQALNNYVVPPTPISERDLAMAEASYMELIVRATRMSVGERKVIPLEEAIGSFGENVKTIAPSTSPGFPMNVSGVENLKKLYFDARSHGNEEDVSMYFSKIKVQVQEILDKIQNRERPFWAYTDCLKDEVRSYEKVLEGKTRLFSACPFTLLLVTRMYYGAFMDNFFGANIEVGSAIGVNCYSEDWDMLARNLLKFSDSSDELCIGAGDYSKFDCREQPQVLESVLGIINAWYGPTHANDNVIRQLLWSEITNSKHVYGKFFYEWFSSLPSGNGMTAMINTIYNQLNYRLSWARAGLDICDFNDNVYVIALGDDSAYTVHRKFRDKFNELQLSDYMTEIGMIYTTESKGVATAEWRRITEIDFLKRSFVFHRGNGVNRWIAPIQIDSIVNMLNWTKRDCDVFSSPDTITANNVNNALRELALHGRDVFESWSSILIELANTELQAKPDVMYVDDYRINLERVLSLDSVF